MPGSKDQKQIDSPASWTNGSGLRRWAGTFTGCSQPAIDEMAAEREEDRNDGQRVPHHIAPGGGGARCVKEDRETVDGAKYDAHEGIERQRGCECRSRQNDCARPRAY